MMAPLLAISLPNGPELMFLFFIVLILFGAKKLPELARGLGKSVGEFRKAKDELDREIHRASADVTPVAVEEPKDRETHKPA